MPYAILDVPRHMPYATAISIAAANSPCFNPLLQVQVTPRTSASEQAPAQTDTTTLVSSGSCWSSESAPIDSLTCCLINGAHQEVVLQCWLGEEDSFDSGVPFSWRNPLSAESEAERSHHICDSKTDWR